MEKNSVPLALPIYRDSGQTQLCNPGTVTAPWSRKGHLQAQCSVQPFLPTSWLRSAEPTCCWFTKKEETLFQGPQLLSLHIPLNIPTLWWESPPLVFSQTPQTQSNETLYLPPVFSIVSISFPESEARESSSEMMWKEENTRRMWRGRQ